MYCAIVVAINSQLDIHNIGKIQIEIMENINFDFIKAKNDLKEKAYNRLKILSSHVKNVFCRDF